MRNSHETFKIVAWQVYGNCVSESQVRLNKTKQHNDCDEMQMFL